MKRKLLNSLAVISAASMIFGVFAPAVIADDIESDEDIAIEETEPEDIDIEVEEADDADIDISVEEADSEEVADATTYYIDQAWVDARSGKLFDDDYSDDDYDKSGTYILDDDVSVSAGCVLRQSVNIVLDLDGNTITYSGTESMIKLGYRDSGNTGKTDATAVAFLTINDSAGNGTIKVDAGYVGGGSASYSNASYGGRGGCVLVEQKSTFTLNAGTIDGFKVFGYTDSEGGGVFVNNGGSFYMNGGTIQNCKAPVGGAAAVSGGGNGGRGLIEITGGLITKNTATAMGGGIATNKGDLHLYGGTIYDNTCTEEGYISNAAAHGGGGVAVRNDHSTIRDQEIYLKNDPKVYGNHSSGDSLRADFFIYGNKSATISGTLSEDAEIHFYGRQGDYNSTTFEFFKNPNNYSFSLTSFTYANSDYYAYKSSGNSVMIAAVVAPSVLGYNLVLEGGAIILKGTADLGNFDNSDTSITYSYEYDKNGTVKSVEETVSYADLAAGGYTFLIPVESACMTATITVTISYKKGDTVYEVTDDVTVESYAKYIINDATGAYSSEAKAAAEALLIYGGYAQAKFGINTDNFPDINGIDFENDAADYGLTAEEYLLPNENYSTYYYGSSVSMLSETEINMYFKKSAFESTPTMSVDWNGDMVTDTDITPVSNGNYWVFTLKGPDGNGISALEYDRSYQCYIDWAENENPALTFDYSVEDYLRQVKFKNANQAMVNLAEAYYNFAEAIYTLATA